MPKALQLQRVDPGVSAREFFSEYVSKRRPAIITGLLDDPAFQGRKWTDLSYLAARAGAVEVTVEPIHPTANQYGTDVERISTSFRDFLNSLRSESGPHPYLTTQYSEGDPDAETVFPPPTNALKDEFPTVPRLMGNLFLQQVNLWLGKSKDGSSSGLHHDFHDNLYCLLQGQKRFVLFPPSEVENLYPHGTLDTLHPNGLISYADVRVRADGLSNRTACRARVHALERKIDALKAQSKGKGKGRPAHSKEMKALVAAHDEALDELAMAALDDDDGGDEVDDFDALMDGLEADGDEDLRAGPSGAVQEDKEGSEEEEWLGIGHSDGSEDAESESGSDSSGEEHDSGSGDDKARPTEPSSFSRIPTALLHKHLDLPTTAASLPQVSAADFPALERAAAPYVAELCAGEMLYLPASWWHEVTSSSSIDDASGSDGVHMAFNYWFYPPDALDRFEAPYADSLVWGYLRAKAGLETVEAPAAERVQVGKRAREKGGGEGSKKARRQGVVG